MSISTKIIEKRKELNFSIEELATQTCMSNKQIIAIESDDYTPFPSDSLRRQCVIKVAKLLKINLDEFPELTNNISLTASETLAYIPEEKPSPFEENFPNKRFKFNTIKKHLVLISLIILSAAAIQHFILNEDISSADLSLPKNSADSGAEAAIEETQVAIDNTNNTPTETATLEPTTPNSSCPNSAQATPVSIDNPIKAPGHIYFESQNVQTVCVSDADGKTETFKVFLGSKYIFDGKQPFTMTANDFSQLTIYYQGRKVPDLRNFQAISLSGKPL
jgi:cytoskeletal protein RodZ